MIHVCLHHIPLPWGGSAILLPVPPHLSHPRSPCSLPGPLPAPSVPAGESELLALSAKGRLVSCGLCSPEEPDVELTPAEIGRRIKELLSGIGDTSER